MVLIGCVATNVAVGACACLRIVLYHHTTDYVKGPRSLHLYLYVESDAAESHYSLRS